MSAATAEPRTTKRTPAPKAEKGTPYIVLVEHNGTLNVHSTQRATNDIAAIHAAHTAEPVTGSSDGSPVTLIAVPARSFRRRQLKVETVVRARVA